MDSASITLIREYFALFCRLVVLETLYIILGFIYQRYVAQAKGLEQCVSYLITMLNIELRRGSYTL